MDGLLERAVTVSVADRCVKTPAHEDLLPIFSVHAAKHVWGRLIWLCDIAQIIKRQNLDGDWTSPNQSPHRLLRALRTKKGSYRTFG